MKALFITLIISTSIFISCNQRSKTNASALEKAKHDSIEAVNRYQDSITAIAKARKDSIAIFEQEKVIGDIRFGMSEKEVKKGIENLRKENRIPDGYYDKQYYKYYIGEFQYNRVVDNYHEGRLYELRIYGDYTPWGAFDLRVPNQIKYITDVIKLKYGEPDVYFDLEPRYNMQEGYLYLINKWIVGKKNIEVNVNDRGEYYPVVVTIYLPKVKALVEIDKRGEEIESAVKAKEVF